MKTYFIHYNFSTLYKLEIEENNGRIYFKEGDEFTFLSSFSFKRMILPQHTDKYDPTIEEDLDNHYYGIVFELTKDKYLYIYDGIYEFKPLKPIQELYSPIRKNDVAYVYGIDEENNHYLFLENVILPSSHHTITQHPYDYFYANSMIVNDRKNIHYKDIKKFFINGVEYRMTYLANPEEHYKFLMECDDFRENNEEKTVLHYETTNGELEIMSKSMYINIIKSFGKLHHYKPIKLLKKIR